MNIIINIDRTTIMRIVFIITIIVYTSYGFYLQSSINNSNRHKCVTYLTRTSDSIVPLNETESNYYLPNWVEKNVFKNNKQYRFKKKHHNRNLERLMTVKNKKNYGKN